MNRISKYASPICNLFLKDEKTYRVKPKVGLEQEFYLIDKEFFDKRIDLEYCGMSLVGRDPMVEKEIISHYLGAIPQRVNDFFEDINEQLYDLGIYMEAEHNEVGPNQFEIAIMFENANISVDNNQLLMHILEKTAIRHNLYCLLKEKPFKNMAGSGKHNNYSLSTNYGKNCFSPGKDPKNNHLFLLFLSAMIKVCNKYQNLIRLSSSSVSNDYRLGGSEAPPSIISVFIGKDLENILKSIANDEKIKDIKNKVKIPHLGELSTDSSDRNRTSPIAFTGNKFEFRMLGSSKSAADLNTVINLSMAKVLKEFYQRLEGKDEKDLKTEVYKIVKETYKENSRILFQGDGYSKQWVKEAKKRGLENHKTFLDALVFAKNNSSFDLYKDEKIFSQKEIDSLINVEFEEICKFCQQELEVLSNLIYQEILPSAMKEVKEIKSYLSFLNNEKLKEKAFRINKNVEILLAYGDKIKEILKDLDKINIQEERAIFIQEKTRKITEEIREISDKLENEISRENYSMPRYVDMLKSL